ncbi:MAG: hypothetical protein IPL53_10285 [Ignavibacteria bacterium]|nr:hypothetical protein [Ignavibacteria bacterium]
MYGIITSILFSILHKISETYSIFLFNIVLLICVIILSNSYLKRKNSSGILKLFIFLSLITSSYSYLERYELINLILLIFQLNLFVNDSNSINNTKTFLISIITAVIFLIHIVGGFFSVFLITFIAVKRKLEWRFYLKYYLLIISMIVLVYLPIILINFKGWYENFFGVYIASSGEAYHGPYFWGLIKYFYISPFTFLPFLLILFATKSNMRRVAYEISMLFIFLLFISLFGAYYYYIYIFVYILWRAGNLNYAVNVRTSIVILIIFLSPYLTHYLPTYSQLSNRKYSDNFRNILEHIYAENYTARYDKVWCNSPISMPLIKYSNARLFHQFYEERFDLKENDIILIVNPRFIETLKNKFGLSYSQITIKEIFPPVLPDYTVNLDWKFHQRNIPIGLYEITLNKNLSVK